MNYDKLRLAEANFLQRYPGGFDDPEMASIKKKHDIDKLGEFARTSFARDNFRHPESITEAVQKVVSRSSMVSRFEKPKFRDFIQSLNSQEKEMLAAAFEKRLYGRSKGQGFDELLGMLAHYKLAKWSVISVVPFYFSPRSEAFVKPTTAKGILRFLEVEDLVYKPMPSWDFYQGYRRLLDEIGKAVVPTLAPNNAAVSGFMMMSL